MTEKTEVYEVPATPEESKIQAARFMRELAGIEKEKQEVKAVYQAEKENLDRWRDERIAILENSASHALQILQLLAPVLITGSKKKSISTPKGAFGYRKKRPTLTVTDEEKALRYSEEHSLEIERKPKAAVLKKHLLGFKKKDGKYVDEDGVEIDLSRVGVEIDDEQPNNGRGVFFVKPEVG